MPEFATTDWTRQLLMFMTLHRYRYLKIARQTEQHHQRANKRYQNQTCLLSGVHPYYCFPISTLTKFIKEATVDGLRDFQFASTGLFFLFYLFSTIINLHSALHYKLNSNNWVCKSDDDQAAPRRIINDNNDLQNEHEIHWSYYVVPIFNRGEQMMPDHFHKLKDVLVEVGATITYEVMTTKLGKTDNFYADISYIIVLQDAPLPTFPSKKRGNGNVPNHPIKKKCTFQIVWYSVRHFFSCRTYVLICLFVAHGRCRSLSSFSK
jgi:hypothetical protein